MSNVQWSGGGPKGMIAWATARIKATQDEAVALVARTVADGALEQKAILGEPRSYTKTGIARVASGAGRSAGRDRTGADPNGGHMIASIDTEVDIEADDLEHFVVAGYWGWPVLEDYFTAQDDGTAKIAAAHSLRDSFAKTSEVFKQRVEHLAQGRTEGF